MMSLIQCVRLTVTFLCVQILMSAQKREMAVNTFAEIQLAPIIVCVEMDIICIKMGNLAWVGMLYSVKSLDFSSRHHLRQRIVIHFIFTMILRYANELFSLLTYSISLTCSGNNHQNNNSNSCSVYQVLLPCKFVLRLSV